MTGDAMKAWEDDPNPIYEAALAAVAEIAPDVPHWIITLAVNAAFAEAEVRADSVRRGE